MKSPIPITAGVGQNENSC